MGLFGAGISRSITRAGQFTVYLLFRAVEALIGITGIETVALTGKVLGSLAWAVLPGYRKLAFHNLGIAFGREKSDAWRRRMVLEHFRCMGANFLCGLKLPLMSESEVADRVTVEDMDIAAGVVASGKPLLFAVSHLSCWELLTQTPSLFTFGLKPGSIYQPLANPFLEAHVKMRRERLGYILFDRTQGFSVPIKHVRDGQSVTGVLVDQHAGDKGVWSPFFDRLCSTTNLAGLMSLRGHTPLMMLLVLDDGLGRWRMVVSPIIQSGEARPTADGLTAALNIALEGVIRRAPENWFWVHDRWKTPEPAFFLSKYRRGLTLPIGYDPQRLQPFHLLVRSPNWLGDACMALPAVRAMKRGRPDIFLTILAPAKLGEWWKSVPEVDRVIHKEKGDDIGAVARSIRSAGSFDAAILLTNSTRSALEIWRAGIPRRVGYRGSLRSWWLNEIVPESESKGPPEHHARRYLRLADHCGADVSEEEKELAPSIRTATSSTVTDSDSPAPAPLRIGICAGAEYGPAKRWPLERFAEVAKRLAARLPDAEWLLFGAPGEKAMGEQLSGLLPGVRHRNLVGATSLSDLMQHLRQCRVLLTNDTGTMHLAAALGVPTVSIFGSTEPLLTGPLGKRHRVVRHHVACSPCFKRECPFGHYECMTEVSAERVETELLGAVKFH